MLSCAIWNYKIAPGVPRGARTEVVLGNPVADI